VLDFSLPRLHESAGSSPFQVEEMTVFCSNTGWAFKLQLSSPLALIAGKLVLLIKEQITALLTV
jgi:hypothetical protein